MTATSASVIGRVAVAGLAALALLAQPLAAAAAGVSDPRAVLRPRPLPLQPPARWFTDPTFRTTLVRVSATSRTGGFETPIYSQLQAFSTDRRYLLLVGSRGYVVRRTDTLRLLRGLDTSGWLAPRWHPAHPHVVVHFDPNSDRRVAVRLTNVRTGGRRTIFWFPAPYTHVLANQSFDEVSDDGRWLAGMVQDRWGRAYVFTLDLVAARLGTLFSVRSLYAGPCRRDPTWGEILPDWVGVSPLGRYLVIQWPRDGTTRCSGLEAFRLRGGAFVARAYDGHQHGDLGVLPGGRGEFFMTFELYHPSGRPSLGLRMLPGRPIVSPPLYLRLLDWGQPGHISCRGPAGVCLVSTGVAGGRWRPFDGELFLQYTDRTVLRLAHHRSSSCGYWVQPRATLSRDGRLAAFASDWSHGSPRNGCAGGADLGRGDPYLVRVPARSGG